MSHPSGTSGQPDPWTNPTPPPPPPPPSGGHGAFGYGAPGHGQPGFGPAVQYPPSPEERTMAMLAHLLGLASGLVLGMPFLGPLIIYLVKKDESPYVRQHAAEALNLTLTGLIVSMGLSIVACVLTLVVIGAFLFLLLIPYGIMLLAFMIIAATAANRGEWYKYPSWLRIPMVS